MYEVQKQPDAEAFLENGAPIKPVATLKDPHGGISHIIVDDHCYVLVNGATDRPFQMTSWWYQEAVSVLHTLPLPK